MFFMTNLLVTSCLIRLFLVTRSGVVCWGPIKDRLGVSYLSENYMVLYSGKGFVCGISPGSNDVKCWGNTTDSSSALGPVLNC